MSARLATATSLGLREQLRRPLLLVLLLVVPFIFITRAIVATVPQPRPLPLPGGEVFASNMRDVHGATMAAITIAFLAGLCGLFIMQAAREGDRRLVIAGFRPFETVVPRLLVIALATMLVLVVSMAVTAINFTPDSWPPFIVGNLLVGLSYAGIGALAGVALGQLGGTYLMLFLPMIDLGIAQTPMFGDGAPDGWAYALPGYGPGRVIVDGAFTPEFHAWGQLAIGLAWTAVIGLAVTLLLARAVRPRGGAINW